MNVKLQKLLMTGCRDMDKKHQKSPRNGGFPPFVTPRFFFKIGLLSLLNPYGALTLCKKVEKTNEQSLTYLHKDGHTDGLKHGRTDKGDY